MSTNLHGSERYRLSILDSTIQTEKVICIGKIQYTVRQKRNHYYHGQEQMQMVIAALTCITFCILLEKKRWKSYFQKKDENKNIFTTKFRVRVITSIISELRKVNTYCYKLVIMPCNPVLKTNIISTLCSTQRSSRWRHLNSP